MLRYWCCFLNSIALEVSDQVQESYICEQMGNLEINPFFWMNTFQALLFLIYVREKKNTFQALSQVRWLDHVIQKT